MPSQKPTLKTHGPLFPLLSAAIVLMCSSHAICGQLTDLGRLGNKHVAAKFSAYTAQHPAGACRASGRGPRVIITGYGLSGAGYNISGEVVRALANPYFWPAETWFADNYNKQKTFTPSVPPGKAENGALSSNRTLRINGESFEVCFLTLDVLWDLSGAILIYEATKFKPQLIVMTGGGAPQAIFEGVAINRTSKSAGYNYDGQREKTLNTPESDWLLDDYPIDHEEFTTWNGPMLAQANRADIEYLGYRVTSPNTLTANNYYICNNIAFLALHATQYNKQTNLAGNKTDGYKISLPPPGLPKKPVVGFFHFPNIPKDHPNLTDYGQEVFIWARVLARTIQASIGRGSSAALSPAPVPVAVKLTPAQAQPGKTESGILDMFSEQSGEDMFGN